MPPKGEGTVSRPQDIEEGGRQGPVAKKRAMNPDHEGSLCSERRRRAFAIWG